MTRTRTRYRAIDKGGATLDCFLADRRNAEAAKRFLSAALKRSRDWIPRVINTDKNPAYGEAIAELKQEGAIPAELEHRQAHRSTRQENERGGPPGVISVVPVGSRRTPPRVRSARTGVPSLL
jgi:transposase-like protein